jgi:KDO2-lipid IV(A) lauroyltransferase
VTASFFLGLFPLRVISPLAGFVGRIFYYILRKERQGALDNLAMAFPEKSPEERRDIAKKVFSNLARNYAELLTVNKYNRNEIFSLVDSASFEKIANALKLGKGGIISASHFGNWEFVTIWITANGYPGTIIVRKVYFHKYEEYLSKLRKSKSGIKIVYRDDSPRKILEILRKNQLLGILADQDIDSVEGVFVNFFGKLAYTPVAPAKIAMASGAPLIPCFMIRKNNKFEFIIEEPIFVEKKGDRDEIVKHYTQKLSQLLESYIRKYPDQWVWMHRRWKTQPVFAGDSV